MNTHTLDVTGYLTDLLLFLCHDVSRVLLKIINLMSKPSTHTYTLPILNSKECTNIDTNEKTDRHTQNHDIYCW